MFSNAPPSIKLSSSSSWKYFKRNHKRIKKMKLTLVFICMMFLQLNAKGYSQNVTLHMKDAVLEKVFKEIENQTSYGFLYTRNALQKARKVTLNVSNGSLENVLRICLENQGLTYSIHENTKTIVIKKSAIRQERIMETPSKQIPDAPKELQDIEVKGTVKSDESGEPLSGATITLKGTKNAVVTDNNGHFKITVEVGSALIVSYIGFENSEIKVKDAGPLEVKLKRSTISMNEMVITGVYSRPKENFTGASSSFTAEEIKKVSNTNIINAIQSLDPSFQLFENLNLGSNPNAMPDVVIRSGNSLVDISQSSTVPFGYTSGPNIPLFILDGFEVSLQRINDLDINRIIKVDILKDAAATAIYGSRAANGIIVIETMRPKNGKLQFTYTGNITIEAPDLTSYDLLNATEKFDIENKANAYTFYDWNFREQELAYFYNERLSAIERGVNTDWLSQPVQTGFGHKNSIYIEGGGNDALYGINLSYNKIAGAMKGSERQTMSANTFLSYRVKSFQFRNDLNIVSNFAKNSPYGSFTQYTRLNPYWAPYDSSGNLNVYLEDIRDIYGRRLTNFDNYDNLDGQGVGRATNPLYNASLNTIDQSNYKTLSNNFFVQWQTNSWLRFSGRFAYQYQADESDRFLPGQHTSFLTKPTFEKGTYTKGYGKKNNFEGMLTADINKSFGSHQIFATAGANMQQAQFNTENFTVQGFPNPRLDQLVLGNSFPENTKPVGSESLSRLLGLLSNISYSYDNRYLLDFSYRIDGSSQFGSEKRFAPFWSAGAGWNLHHEKAIKNLGLVDRLKLRYSFGYTGSQNFASYLGVSTSQYYTDRDYRGVIGTYLLGYGNAALAWQKTEKSNFGADITINKKLDITGNYFIEKTKGSIASISTAPSSGFNSYSENMGDVISHGWELFTRYNFISDNVKRNNLSLFANFFSVKNKIEKVSNSIAALNESANSTKTSRPITRYAAGQSTTSIWAVPSLGIDPSTGHEIFLKRDGTLTNVYDPLDQVIVGDSRPKIEGTFGVNMEMNGLGINLYMRFRNGGQTYNQTLVERVENVNAAYYNVDRRVYEERWQKPGDVTFFKGIIDNAGYAITEPTYTTSRFVQDDNLLSFENLSIYYRFSNSLNERFNLQNSRITIFTSDIFRFSSIKRERGLDYPFAKTFSIQFQTSF